MNEPTQDLKTKILKIFIANPKTICVSGEYIFFKKYFAFAGGSHLYRMKTNGRKCKAIVKKPVGLYNIYDNQIYYTIESPNRNIFW